MKTMTLEEYHAALKAQGTRDPAEIVVLGRRTAAYRLRQYADNPRKEKEDVRKHESWGTD